MQQCFLARLNHDTFRNYVANIPVDKRFWRNVGIETAFSSLPAETLRSHIGKINLLPAADGSNAGKIFNMTYFNIDIKTNILLKYKSNAFL